MERTSTAGSPLSHGQNWEDTVRKSWK